MTRTGKPYVAVPADEFMAVIEEWERAGYVRSVWRNSNNRLRKAVAQFIDATGRADP